MTAEQSIEAASAPLPSPLPCEEIAPFEPIGSVALRIVAGLAEMGRSDDDSAPRG